MFSFGAEICIEWLGGKNYPNHVDWYWKYFYRKIVTYRKKIIISTTKIPYGPLEQLVVLVCFIFGILAYLTFFFSKYNIYVLFTLYLHSHLFSHVGSLAYAFIFTLKRHLWDTCFEYMSLCICICIFIYVIYTGFEVL